ncbi:hypothetical protein SVIO_004800 [Streptomyces violaceusniger]|uniref:Uncharacterized protein n=1 Tax=Streptomyces violaceusniger TaxID=68280 RepID=A0A4D4KTS0_STRVO|nr:hypothetical protein SVIO_004800 [Streptomyces violaceusniger]
MARTVAGSGGRQRAGRLLGRPGAVEERLADGVRAFPVSQRWVARDSSMASGTGAERDFRATTTASRSAGSGVVASGTPKTSTVRREAGRSSVGLDGDGMPCQ